ncbi:unnamed protein product [Arctia plantaginis]|uniref:Uncharacterized protein n=1 Tax=Arctia plantaginis TaxID=874455 RepID=A0A8S0Z3M4_ARCPL|nr:unnamed protein product [Arctia plantaginis]
MITPIQVFVLFALIQMICAEFDELGPEVPIDPSIPVDCYYPPDNVNLHDCCPVNQLFHDRDLANCGFKLPDNSKPWKSRDCSPRICIFKKHNLLHVNETINYDAMALYLDKWSENQHNIADGVNEAKRICFGKKDGPPVPQKPFGTFHHVPCEVDRLLICIRSNVIWNCKQNERAPGCKKLGNHMKKCKQYLYKEIPTE